MYCVVDDGAKVLKFINYFGAIKQRCLLDAKRSIFMALALLLCRGQNLSLFSVAAQGDHECGNLVLRQSVPIKIHPLLSLY